MKTSIIAILLTTVSGFAQIFQVDTTIVLPHEVVNIGRYQPGEIPLPQMVGLEEIKGQKYLKFEVILRRDFDKMYQELKQKGRMQVVAIGAGKESYKVNIEFSEDFSYFDIHKAHTDPELKDLPSFGIYRVYENGKIYTKINKVIEINLENKDFYALAWNASITSLNRNFWNNFKFLNE